MKVSECRVKLWPREPVRAIVSITLDDQFVVKGIRILNVQNRFIVCMPSRPGPDGRHRDVAHPINSATREKLNHHILEAYRQELERSNGHALGAYADEELPEAEDHSEAGVWAR